MQEMDAWQVAQIKSLQILITLETSLRHKDGIIIGSTGELAKAQAQDK